MLFGVKTIMAETSSDATTVQVHVGETTLRDQASSVFNMVAEPGGHQHALRAPGSTAMVPHQRVPSSSSLGLPTNDGAVEEHSLALSLTPEERKPRSGRHPSKQSGRQGSRDDSAHSPTPLTHSLTHTHTLTHSLTNWLTN